MQVDNLNMVIDQISKDKSIDRKVLHEALEQAILTAAKKVFGYDRELEAVFNEELGQVELFQYMVVVEETFFEIFSQIVIFSQFYESQSF